MATVLQRIKEQVRRNPNACAIKVAPGNEEFNYERFWHVCTSVKIPNCGHRSVACIALANDGLHLCLMQIALLIRDYTIVHVDPVDPRLENLLEDCSPSIAVVNDAKAAERVQDICNAEVVVIDSRKTLAMFLPTPTRHESAITGYPVESVTSSSICSIYYTSGSTGLPKGCVLDHAAVLSYSLHRNEVHSISANSKVLLASAATFDPCLGDTLCTFCAGACLVVPQESNVYSFVGVPNFHQDILETFEITHCQCTPGFWDAVTTAAASLGSSRASIGKHDYSGLEVLALGGESLERFWPLRGQFKRLINTYGVTECYCYQTYQILSCSSSTEDIRSIGLPYPGNDLFLVPDEEVEKGNLETMVKVTGDVNMLDPTVTYMIVIGGAQLGRYLNRPNEEARRFIRSDDGTRYYNTGDIGALDSQGRLLIKGRKDFQVKIAGTRVELEDIEAGIQKTRLVESVTCVLVENEERQPALVACCKIQVETSGSSTASSSPSTSKVWEADSNLLFEGGSRVQMMLTFTLRQASQQYLPSKLVPKNLLFFRKPLPRTPNDKIDRNALVEIWKNRKDGANVGGVNRDDSVDCQKVLDLTAEEQFVSNVWHGELGLPAGCILDKSDNFFDLGGESLSALNVCRKLLGLLFPKEEILQDIVNDFGDIKRQEFTVNTLYKYPTLEQYAQNVFSNVQLSNQQEADTTAAMAFMTPESGVFLDVDKETNRSGGEERKVACPVEGSWPYDDTATRHLFVGVQQNLPTFVTKLLQLNANPNGWLYDTKLKCSKDKERRPLTPLHVASSQGFMEVVKALIEHDGIKVGLQEKHGVLPLFVSKSVEVFDLIYRKQPHLLTAKDDNRQTILHFMARSGNYDILKYVLFDGNNGKGLWAVRDYACHKSVVDWRDKWHRTPMAWAILNDHVGCVELLLSAKSDVNTKIREKRHKKDSHLPNESALELAQRIGFPLKDIIRRNCSHPVGKSRSKENLCSQHKTSPPSQCTFSGEAK